MSETAKESLNFIEQIIHDDLETGVTKNYCSRYHSVVVCSIMKPLASITKEKHNRTNFIFYQYNLKANLNNQLEARGFTMLHTTTEW